MLKTNLDLAHIPYCKVDLFVDTSIKYNYFTYIRNPYDRIISAFFSLNKNKNISDFMFFCKNTLPQCKLILILIKI